MKDKTVKWLVAGIVLLLGANAWQLGLGLKPAQAQSANTRTVQPVITTGNGLLYILRGNQLSVYSMDNTMMDAIVNDPSSMAQAMQGAGKEKFLKSYKLRKILSEDVSH